MKNYTKIYVGKGKKSTDFSTKFTVSVENVLKHAYTKNGHDYFTFEISQMRQADEFGKTHTMYVTVLETVATPEPAPAGVVNEAELPFGEQPATTTAAPPKKRKSRKLIPA